MSRRSEEIRNKLNNARTMPVHGFGHGRSRITYEEALRDRRDAISELETELAQVDAEESGSFLWGR